MSTPPIRVLIVDDEPAHAEAVRRALLDAETSMDVQVAGSLREFREAVANRPPNLVLLDLLLPDGRADAALISPPETGPFPMVVMTSYGDEQIAVSAIRQGALDYVVKSPQAFADMPRVVERTLRSWHVLQENRQAHEALRKNERVLRMALEVGRIGAFEVELATGRSTWSSTVDEMWGLPAGFAGDFPGYCWQHIHPDDLERVRRFYADFLQQNQEQETEFRVVRPDGTVRWLRWRARVIRDEAGAGVRVVGVNQDITERRLLELERESALIKYRTLFDTLPLGITVADQQGRIIETNRVAEELLGLPAQEHLQRDIGGPQWRIVRPDGTPMPADEFASVRALREQRVVRDVEMGLVKSPTETTWITVTAAPVPLPDVGVVVAYNDIGARKKAEEALKASEARFRGTLESMMEGCQIIGFDWRFRFVNPAAAKHGRSTVEALLGRTMMEVYPGVETTPMFGRLQQCMNERTAQQLENEFTYPDGSKGWFQLLIQPMDEGIFILSVDITERKRAEKRLRKMSEVQAALHDPATLDQKLRRITEAVVDIFDADFVRIWLTRRGDLCEAGCVHAEVTEGPHACRDRDRCLHLLASSGRYTHLDGKVHGRVPFGCYKIGRVASGEEPSFLTNDVTHDPRVHHHEWAHELGLVAFAGYQLRPPHGETIGVMAIFSQHAITSEEDALLRNLSNLIVPVIQAAQAAETLRQSEANLNRAQAVGHIGSWHLDLTQNRLTWSAETHRIFGVPAGVPLTYEAFLAHVHPADRAMVDAAWQAALSGAAYDSQHRIVVGDAVKWVRERAELEFDARGRLRGGLGTVQDITELKQAAEALAEREAIFSSIVSQAEDAIALFDGATGRFVEFNTAAHQGLGYTREEFARLSVADFQAEHSPEVIRQNAEAIREGGELTFETRHRHRNGSLRDVRVNIRMLRIRDRDYMAAVWTDVTERKLAEARAARESMRTAFLLELHQRAPQLTDRELFDHVLERAVQLTESSVGFLHQVSEDQQAILLTTWNQEALRTCTLTYDTHHPLREAGNWADCVRQRGPVVCNDYAQSPHPRGLPEGHAPVRRFMSIPVVRDGKVRIIFGVGNKATDYTDGDVEQLLVVANELHKIKIQRAAQNQLRRSEERFRQLAETMSDWIWETDATGRYSYASPKVEELLGYAPEDVMGRTPFDFMPAAEAQRVSAVFYDVLKDRKPFFNLENTNLHRNGRQVLLETSGTPVFGDDGQFLGYRGIDRDVSERRRLEAQLRQAQKQEAIGQLAGGVAHDFNNILFAIMLQLGLLEMNASLDAEASQAVKDLNAQAQRAASLTRQLLMFSRRSVIEAKPLDLNEVVSNLLKMLGRLIGEHIRLVFDVQPGFLPCVNADAGMLEQVIMNLVVNARDAMPKGGRITITTAVELLGLQAAALNPMRQPGRFVCLAVADHGVGMNEDTLKRIFDPFFTTKEPGKGTGLGLATVHGIVAQHKGWVEVESEVGKGSTFRVYLPAITETVSPPLEETPREPLQRGRETILLVEDETNVRQVVSQTLRALGYRVYEAEHGQQALHLWQQHGPEVDLLFTDMVMPEGLTGLELAEHLQALKPSLKVILTSGYSAEIFRSGGITQAGICYLPKPFESQTLAKTIRACLDEET